MSSFPTLCHLSHTGQKEKLLHPLVHFLHHRAQHPSIPVVPIQPAARLTAHLHAANVELSFTSTRGIITRLQRGSRCYLPAWKCKNRVSPALREPQWGAYCASRSLSPFPPSAITASSVFPLSSVFSFYYQAYPVPRFCRAADIGTAAFSGLGLPKIFSPRSCFYRSAAAQCQIDAVPISIAGLCRVSLVIFWRRNSSLCQFLWRTCIGFFVSLMNVMAYNPCSDGIIQWLHGKIGKIVCIVDFASSNSWL